ncbi:hypothetical protein FQN60_015997, partial [Etheostoma spectabile]
TRQGDKVPQNASPVQSSAFQTRTCGYARRGTDCRHAVGADNNGEVSCHSSKSICPLKNESVTSSQLLPRGMPSSAVLPSPVNESALHRAALSQTLGLPPESRARPDGGDPSQEHSATNCSFMR